MAGEAKYNWSIKSKIKLGSKSYGVVYATDDSHLAPFKSLVDAQLNDWAKMQISKEICPSGKMSIPETNQKDRKTGYMTFFDSTAPDKKFRLAINGLKSNASVVTLGNGIAGLANKLKYAVVTPAQGENPEVTTYYTINSYIEPGSGRIVDTFAGDIASSDETPE